MEDVISRTPLITNDAAVFGLLMALLMLIFKTATDVRFSKFYKVIPALLLCYFLPSLFSTLGIISPGWIEFDAAISYLLQLGHPVAEINTLAALKNYVAENPELAKELKPFIKKSQLYFMASRYLLPASLILLTLSINLRAVFKLGPKALTMFFAATAGIILGGPLAILIYSFISPDVVSGEVWRGMTTIAGSWIGGGANQAAMFELWKPSQQLFSVMITVDVIVAEIWMAFILLGVGRTEAINRFFRADNSAVEALQEKMQAFSDKVSKVPTFPDFMIILGVAFGLVGLSHFGADWIAPWIQENAPHLKKFSLTSGFFWLIVLATSFGLLLSFTKARNLEGAGASKLGSVFIYVLVATIGMKMNVMEIFNHPQLFLVGLIWMIIHVIILVVVAYIIKAPYFFLAVGSKANIGGAASAPVVAAAFHPSLAPVGVLLAVLGYALGTYGAWLCGVLMEMAAPA